MADRASSKENTVFARLSTPSFDDQVASTISKRFNIAAIYSEDLDLGRPFWNMHVIVSISMRAGTPRENMTRALLRLVEAFPHSNFYFIVPADEQHAAVEEYLSSILTNDDSPERSIVSIDEFLSVHEQRLVRFTGHGYESAGEDDETASGERSTLGVERISEEITVTFDTSLSPKQIKETLTALAAYYRACGGVGLPAEFESEEAEVLEDALV